MGNTITNCENCFSAKDLDPRKSSLNHNYQEKKNSAQLKELYRSNNGQKLQIPIQKQETNTSDDKHHSPKSTASSKNEGLAHQHQDKKNKKLTIEDFRLVRVIGRGSFGKVYLVQKKDNGKYYALKTLKKEEVLNKNQIDNALTEKKVLQDAFHPFVVRLRYSFQNESTLYMIMDYLPGGELFTHLKKRGRFDEETARFYACEVILALEYLHDKLDIIYRYSNQKEKSNLFSDLKPENILLDTAGHLRITDFGLSKSTKKTFSFCGTPEYLAPEILIGQGHDKAVDWWSLGCLIYEMLAGYPPFPSKNRKQLYNDILKVQPIMPPHFSEKAKDLLTKLLTRDPLKRLGAKGASEIKSHPFFADVKWEDVLHKKKNPPIVPTVRKPEDVGNFDRMYVNEPVVETPSNPQKILNDPRNNFTGFTYVQNDILNQSYIDDSKLKLNNKN